MWEEDGDENLKALPLENTTNLRIRKRPKELEERLLNSMAELEFLKLINGKVENTITCLQQLGQQNRVSLDLPKLGLSPQTAAMAKV